ncbi:MAG TPA: phosphate ABC transporter substrate-binding protein [Tepidimicrobium sp.]|nr:phosphate ABC transporter substrate-binding protein [Tepidimicrobium sp.]
MVFAITCIFAIFAVGCSNNSNQDGNRDGVVQNGAQQNGQELIGSIQIAGSTSVQPLSEELAMEFMKLHPKVKINVAGGGSGAGIRSAQDGTADIGASSRTLKDEEKTVKEFTIAKDGLAIVVNRENKVEGLTMDQAMQVFTGKITNWRELGGSDAPITVVIREDGSGTRGAFQEIVLGKEESFTEDALIQNSTGALRTVVSGNPDAIGFISLGALNEDVKALKIDGVEASKENVINDTYTLARPFLYLTESEPQGLVKSFIDFVLSQEGQKIVEVKFVPVK